MALNNDFKIKNGLTVNTTVSAGSCIEGDSFIKHDGTSSQFLKADGSVDSTAYTTCLGDITSVTAGNYLTGGASSGDATIGLDSACAAKWDTASAGGVQTFTAGDGLTDSGTATDPNVAVDSTVVRTTGAQSIAGVKSFSDDLVVDTDTLFVDVSTDSVGINTNTPGEALEVVGNVEASGEFIGNLRGAVHFKAQAGEDISEGEAVYISGISGNTTVVSLADADDASKMPAFGIATETASSGNPITVGNFGLLANLNTTQWGTEGTELYVGTTAGQLVSAAPTGSTAALQKIAKITKAHASSGSITIMGAGRSNAVPNLDNGDIFIGNGSNQAVTASLAACVCGTGDSRYITGVTAGTLLSGGATSGDATLGIDSGALDYLNQSACAGLNCVGDVTTSTNQSISGNKTFACFAQFDQSVGMSCDLYVTNDIYAYNNLYVGTCLDVTGSILSGGTELHSLFGGGGISAGTACKLTKYSSGGTDIEDSIVTESTSLITIAGALDVDNICSNDACNNIKYGLNAGMSITSGCDNIALGHDALCGSTTGCYNVAIGRKAMIKAVTGEDNVAIGQEVLFENTTGECNVALGTKSMACNTTGSYNVSIGQQASFYALSGDHNMAMGQYALYDNWGGDYNTAIGTASMQCNTVGSNNAALGYRAMFNNTTGNDNFAVGECALQSNVNGIGNTALGHNAFGSSVTGNYSVAIGDNAGTYFANGCTTLSAASDSIYIGRNTRGKDNNDSNSIVIGYNACSCGANTIKLGSNSITAACIQVAWTAVSDERDKTDITDLNHGLEFIGDLKPKAFKYRKTRTSSANDGVCRYGFLAQDIQETEDGAKVIVSESNPEQLGLNSDYLVPILVKAVQELEQRVKELEG